jgi:hypothetical protein
MSAQDEVALHHPMMFGEIVGREWVEQLAAAAAGVFAAIEPQHAWRGADIGGREWHGRFEDRQIRGVTVARRSGTRIEVDIFLGSFPAPVRRALYDASRDLVDVDAWVLPAEVSTALPPIPRRRSAGCQAPFGITDEMFRPARWPASRYAARRCRARAAIRSRSMAGRERAASVGRCDDAEPGPARSAAAAGSGQRHLLGRRAQRQEHGMAMRPWRSSRCSRRGCGHGRCRFSTRRISKRTPNPNPHRATA